MSEPRIQCQTVAKVVALEGCQAAAQRPEGQLTGCGNPVGSQRADPQLPCRRRLATGLDHLSPQPLEVPSPGMYPLCPTSAVTQRGEPGRAGAPPGPADDL